MVVQKFFLYVQGTVQRFENQLKDVFWNNMFWEINYTIVLWVSLEKMTYISKMGLAWTFFHLVLKRHDMKVIFNTF